MRRSLALLILLLVAAPADARVSVRKATGIAIGALTKREGPVQIYRRPVGPKSLVAEAGPTLGSAGTRAVVRGYRTITASRIPRPRAGHRGWLFWGDGAPGAAFPHVGAFVVVTRSGRIVRRQDTTFQPAGRLGKRVFTRSVGTAAAATASDLKRYWDDPQLAPPLEAKLDPRLDGPETSTECMFLMRDRFDTDTFGGNLASEKQFAANQNAILYDASNGDALNADLTDAEGRGCTDAIIAIDAHGAGPGVTPDPAVLLRGTPTENALQPEVPGFSTKNGPAMRGEWFTSKNFRDIAAAHPGTTFKLIVDTCHAGRWIDDLRADPPPNLGVGVGSSRPEEQSWRNKNPKLPDAFWKTIVDGFPNPTPDLPNNLWKEIKEKFVPDPNWDIQHPQGVSALGYFDGSDQEVSGQVLTGCTVALTIDGAFAYDNVWGTGSVNGIANGYTSHASGEVPCGTLTAKPDRGMQFVGWANGCSGNALTCSVSSKATVNAVFVPSEHTITVVNNNKDAGYVRAGADVDGPLYCGTYYNGPTVTRGTDCSVPARAAASDKDLRTLTLQPNFQTPDGKGITWEVDQVTGCDVVSRGGYGAGCQIVLDSDRTVTVTWKVFTP